MKKKNAMYVRLFINVCLTAFMVYKATIQEIPFVWAALAIYGAGVLVAIVVRTMQGRGE